MDNYYNLDGVRTYLTRLLQETKVKIQAWEKVTYNTKKDGTPFQNMSKNINGAIYRQEAYAMQPGENHLSVHEFGNGVGYVSDDIYCYIHVARMADDDPRKEKIENYMPEQPYLERIYKYDLDDIKQAVIDRIAYLHGKVETISGQLENLNKAYNDFKAAYSAAFEQLEKAIDKNSDSRAFYAVLNTVKERYPYC